MNSLQEYEDDMWYNCQGDCYGAQHEYSYVASVTHKGIVYQCSGNEGIYDSGWYSVKQGPATLKWHQSSDFGYDPEFLEVRSVDWDPSDRVLYNRMTYGSPRW